MPNLLRNEWMKLWSKKGTYVMLGILLSITVAMMFLNKWLETMESSSVTEAGNSTVSVTVPEKTDWKIDAQDQLSYLNIRLETEELSEKSKKRIEGEAKVLEHRLAHDIAPVDRYSREAMVMDPSGLSGTVLLLTVIVAAGIVASEFSQGTIKMLLTRPVKRWKILTAKFLTVNFYGILLMLAGYAALILCAFLLFKSGGGQELAYNGSEVVEVSMWGQSLYMLLLSFGSVFITATFAFAVGSVFRSSSLAIGLSLFIYFSGSMVTALLSRYEVAKYLLFTHMDLTQFETGMMLIEDITLPFSLAVSAVYVLLFLLVSYTVFVKRDVTA